MAKTTDRWVIEEFSGADLGDKRRENRLLKIAESMRQHPEASLPGLLGGEAELEGAYRFFSNDAVGYEDILHPHTVKSAARCASVAEALVLHDTTDIRFDCYGDVQRKSLTRVSKNGQGFFLHTSLAVTAGGGRFPLGVLSARPFVHKQHVEDEACRQWWKDRDGILDNERDRWLQGIIAAEEAAPDASLIHVCDREGDGYELIGSLIELDSRFVIRLTHNRKIIDEYGGAMRLDDALDAVSFQPELDRTISIQPRYGVPKSGAKSRRHKHAGRRAKVSFRATQVTFARPHNRPEYDYIERPVTVNVVEVVEKNPPKEQKPVRWLLATTEPIDSIDALVRIVDIYLTRWVIEEFFKAIKTGCSYEKRQISSAKALLNVLGVTLPVAVHMLMLRDLAHAPPDAPASWLFDPVCLLVMRALTSKKVVPDDPTAFNALCAIAKIGGHIKNNGPPGFLVLYRGYVELMAAKRGVEATFAFADLEIPKM